MAAANITAGAGISVAIAPGPPEGVIISATGGGGGSQWTDILGGGIYYNGGKVGIGTTTPQTPLHVNGTTCITGSSAVFPTSGQALMLTFGQDFNAASVFAYDSDANDYFGLVFSGKPITLNSRADVIFNMTNAFWTVQERMRLTNAGNLGIGTPTPQAALDVAGDIRLGGGPGPNYLEIVNDVGDDWAINVNGGGGSLPGSLLLWNRRSGAIPFVIDASGNVGIGTLTPQAALDVNGQINTTQLHIYGAPSPTYDAYPADINCQYASLRFNAPSSGILFFVTWMLPLVIGQYNIIMNVQNGLTIQNLTTTPGDAGSGVVYVDANGFLKLS